MSRNSLDEALSHYHQPDNVFLVRHAFLHAHPAPPITVASLQPMQYHTGMKMQPKLRQDLNFDMEIYFRPAGSRDPTQPNLQRAAEYWLAVQCELEYWAILRIARTRFPITETDVQTSILGRNTRLLRMFEEIVALTHLVVPVRYQHEIREVIDPARQVRNIKEGVMPDYRALADYMRGHLLPQCAPERDAFVEAVRDGIAALAIDGSPRAVAGALRGLFGLLFTLKLDISNNQIRSGRSWMISKNDYLTQSYWAYRQELGAFDPRPCIAWYEHALERPASGRLEQADHLRHLALRVITSLRSCIDGQALGECFSEIWQYDFSRFTIITEQIQSLAAQRVCKQNLERLLRERRVSMTAALIERFLQRLSTIVGDASYQSMTGHIALEIAQTVRDGPSPTSMSAARSRSSAAARRSTSDNIEEYNVLRPDMNTVPTQFPAPYGPPGLDFPTAPVQFTRNHGAPSRTTQTLSIGEPPAAMSTNANEPPLNEDDIETALNRDLSPSSPVFATAVAYIFTQLTNLVPTSLIQHSDLEIWQLGDKFLGRTPHPIMLVPGIQYCRAYLTEARERGEVPPGPRLQDIVNRLTHMLAIHWQWAGPVYYAPGSTGKWFNWLTDAPREGDRTTKGYKEELETIPVVRDLMFADCLPGARENLKEVGAGDQIEVVCCDDRAGVYEGLDWSTGGHRHTWGQEEVQQTAGKGEAGPSRAGEAR